MDMTKGRRNGIFAVLLMSCILAATVQTALGSALTPIMAEMGITAGVAQWMVSAYSLVMGIGVLASAFLIRRFASRALFAVFMGLFTAGLLLSAVAQSFAALLIGRILQAVGCGILMNLAQVMILTVYPPQQRGSIMGIYGLAVCAAPVLAPTLAGVVIDLFGWRMIFWGAFALSAITVVVGVIIMKDDGKGTGRIRFDLPSLVLCGGGFAGLVLGLGSWGTYAITSMAVLLPFALGLLLLVAFVHRQDRLQAPFLRLSVFANRQFRLAVIMSALIYGSMMAVATLLPLYAQAMRGLSATVSGLITLPGSLLTAVVSPVAGKLYDRMGIQRITLAGTACLFLGHLLLCFLGETTALWLVAAYYAIRQIGIGLLMMTLVTWGMSGLDAAHTSDGTAIISSLRTIAGAMGSAAFVSVMTATAGGAGTAAMLHGLTIAMIGVTALSAVALVMAVLMAKSEGRKARQE